MTTTRTPAQQRSTIHAQQVSESDRHRDAVLVIYIPDPQEQEEIQEAFK